MIGPVTDARAVIATAILLLGVTACSGDAPEPNIAPTSPATSSEPSDPSTSPVSGPTAPTMPPEAMGDDLAAAEAFVKFYWDSVNYAQATGDTGSLRRLGAKACAACRAGVAKLDDIYDRGGRIVGGVGTVKITNSGLIQKDGLPDVVVDFEVTSTRQRLDMPGTTDDVTVPAGDAQLRMLLRADDGAWVATYWGKR